MIEKTGLRAKGKIWYLSSTIHTQTISLEGNNIHISISYKQKQSVSKIVQLLKGSILLRQDLVSLQKQFWEDVYEQEDT